MTTKQRSYTIRRNIALALDEPRHGDFRCAVGRVRVEFTDGDTALLVRTDNVGFDGIRGWFTHATAPATFTRSLGEVVDFWVVR